MYYVGNIRHEILFFQVLHSQKLSEPPFLPWVIAEKDGKVLAAHCTCMAGLGEACTHIAALLFSLEATVKVRATRTVTDEKSYWLPASMRGVTYNKIEDIDFTSAKSKKKRVDSILEGTPAKKCVGAQPKEVPVPSSQEINVFLQQLNNTGAQSALLSVKDPFYVNFVPEILNDKFPVLLTSLSDTDLLDKNFNDILTYCRKVSLTITPQECANVENATQEQAKSKLWHRFRSGRITASKMYSVCHTNHLSPSHSLLMQICHPETITFSTPATRWGCEHEDSAKEAYKETMSLFHHNFEINNVGLKINPDYPVFGASPDATVSCDCCGVGTLEVKCPYCASSVTEYAARGKQSCLITTDNGKRLRHDHPYYYQVQTQIAICDTDYSDFVVWTEEEVHIERIEQNVSFWEEISRKALRFHDMAVMPELVANFFSRNEKPCMSSSTSDSVISDPTFCYCKQPETPDRPMVACDNEQCQNQWFHLDCLQITTADLPKGRWYCPDCKKNMPKPRKSGKQCLPRKK